MQNQEVYQMIGRYLLEIKGHYDMPIRTIDTLKNCQIH